jgi:hypothetical protein
VIIDGVWIGIGVIGFVGLLRLVTTSSSRAIANSHNLQFTRARTSSSQSAVSSPIVVCLRFQCRRSLIFRAFGLTSSLAGVYLTTRLSVATQRLKTMWAAPPPTSPPGATVSTSGCLGLPAFGLELYSTLDWLSWLVGW